MSRFYTSVVTHKNYILLRGYDNDKIIMNSIKYNPYLFMNSKDTDTPYRTVHGQPVKRFDFETIRDAHDFISSHDGVSGISLYGMRRFVYPFIFDNYPGQIEFDQDRIRIATIDIEVASDKGFPDVNEAKHEVTAITIKMGNLIYAFGCGEFTTTDARVTYYQCDDEELLLRRFLVLWEQLGPDVVTGWNIEGFDIPYMVNRITNVLGEKEAKRLSPWNILRERTITFHNREITVYNPVGIAVLDYLALYKKFTFTQQESYKLDHIANVEIGAKKLDYSEYGSLINLYRQDFQKFMEYNIRDVELVDLIDQKKRLLELVFSLSFEAKVNFEDALTSVTLWDVIIHNYLMEQNIVVPFVNPNKHREFAGAFVKEPRCGAYSWVVSFDLTSLYPMLIQQFNISPETFRGQIPEKISVDKILNGAMDDIMSRYTLRQDNISIAGNLCLYTKEQQGFMPKLMARFFDLRKQSKDQQIALEKEFETTKDPSLPNRIGALKTRQMVIKVVLNSLYGVLGNRYFRWFQVEHAEAITASGQLVIQWAAKCMNEYLNKVLKTKDKDYIIAMDTDSLYITLDDLVNTIPSLKGASSEKIVKFLDMACGTKLNDVLNKGYEELATYMNAYENKMSMKRESIAERAIWTGKKRYIMSVWDNEGVRYDKPKTKIVGLESVRSTTPASCKKAIKEAIDTILHKTETDIQKYISDYRKEYKALDLMDIGIPSGVKGLDKYVDRISIYTKGTPQHVKGSLLYNNLHTKKNITNQPLIYDGDKVKTFMLQMPNPVKDNVIAVPGFLPEEFNIEPYIDKDAMFERSFLSPVTSILDVIGWKPKKQRTLF